MLERRLIAAALADRAAYECIAASDLPAGMDDLVRPIWDEVAAYYDRDPEAGRADPVVVGRVVASKQSNPKRGAEYERLVEEIANDDTDRSIPNIVELVLAERRHRAGTALAAAIAGRRPDSELEPLLSAYLESRAVQSSDASELEPTDWGSVLRARVDGSSRYLVSPRVLNRSIAGGVLPGHNITIFGRPESGKTALAITMACGFARRGKGVLYIGNEDPVQDLMMRMITNLVSKTVDEIGTDPDRYETEALEAGARNIIVRATAPGTMKEIEGLVRKYRPAVLFVDQLRNISSGKSDNYTQLLDKNAQGVRALGKRYGLVTVSVTQAGDSASGKPILDMGDVDSSNTGIPGAADLMIGVGVTEALDNAGQRMLSLCKNKLGVVKPAIPVSFDPFRSKMK